MKFGNVSILYCQIRNRCILLFSKRTCKKIIYHASRLCVLSRFNTEIGKIYCFPFSSWKTRHWRTIVFISNFSPEGKIILLNNNSKSWRIGIESVEFISISIFYVNSELLFYVESLHFYLKSCSWLNVIQQQCGYKIYIKSHMVPSMNKLKKCHKFFAYQSIPPCNLHFFSCL